MRQQNILCVSLIATLAACSDEGQGSVRFTTWGEDFIEKEIPADPGEGGFSDGWSVKYDKFLVAFHAIKVADDRGETAATMGVSKLVDNVRPGKKELVTFSGLPARAWNRVSYQIRPALASSELLGATAADRDLMVSKGYALYAEGSASKGAVRKTFRWGFATATEMSACRAAEEAGRAAEGVVVTSGGSTTAELTTHGDHLFYDRLKASDDPAIETALRFDAIAAADQDGDGEVTMTELAGRPIDVRLYDPSGFDAVNLGAFITQLSRTVGHYRGEGECTVRVIE